MKIPVYMVDSHRVNLLEKLNWKEKSISQFQQNLTALCNTQEFQSISNVKDMVNIVTSNIKLAKAHNIKLNILNLSRIGSIGGVIHSDQLCGETLMYTKKIIVSQTESVCSSQKLSRKVWS